MRFLIAFLLLGITITTRAACPVGGELRKAGSPEALSVYINCALGDNDDDAQAMLGRLYENGEEGLPVNRQRALLFYHLSAENGNATSMVNLSLLLTKMDSDDAMREEISSYMNKIRGNLMYTTQTSFQGQLLHPYALLTLAAESPDSKWFYTTKVKSDARAAKLLKEYQIDPEKKKQVIRDATQWKQRKLQDVAFEVLPLPEFKKFLDTLYPKKGRPDPFARSQVINNLKQRIESKQK